MKFFLCYTLFVHNLMQLLLHIENIYHLCSLDLLLLFSFLSNLENQCKKFILRHLWYGKLAPSKIKSLPFSDVSNSIWYLERSSSRSYLVTSFTLSYVITFVLSLFQCITCSSSVSLEEIKLTAIVNWTVHVPDFWRSFIIPFK